MKTEKVLVGIVITIIVLVLLMVGIIWLAVYPQMDYGIYEGTIVDKKYTSAHTTLQTYYNGKTTSIYPMYHPERWKIKIQKQEDDKTKEVWISVPEQEYNNLKIGDYYAR